MTDINFEGCFTNEQWKQIPDTNYAISNQGRVINWKRGRLLKLQSDKDGYKVVGLSINNKKFLWKIHRLVAQAFIANSDNLPVVNHIDEDRANNLVDNLEWCDVQYNTEYSLAKEYKFKNPEGDVVSLFNLKKFCRENGLHQGSMYHVYHCNRKSHKGWTKA